MPQQHPEYGFLEEDELNAPRNFRTWREDTNQLVAARIFGGAGAPKQKEFPNAFQTYRQERAARPFPFQMNRHMKTREPAPVPTEGATSTTEYGALFSTVRESFVPNSTIQSIITDGIPLLPVESMMLVSSIYFADVRPVTPPYFSQSIDELAKTNT